jgi:prepilin-type processing-associated H-X9-DG protein
VLILPYIEQDNVFKLYQNWGGSDTVKVDFPATVTTGPPFPRYSSGNNPANVTRKRYKVLTCPTDTPNAPIGSGITSHNYAINYGNTNYNQANITTPPPAVTFQAAPFFRGKTWRLNEIYDGTSNTLLVAEVLQGTMQDLRGFTWWGPATFFTTYLPPNSTIPDKMNTGAGANGCRNEPLINLPCTLGPNPGILASRSRHPGGVQVVMGDGSTQFIRDAIDINVWRGLSSIRAGEVVANFAN